MCFKKLTKRKIFYYLYLHFYPLHYSFFLLEVPGPLQLSFPFFLEHFFYPFFKGRSSGVRFLVFLHLGVAVFLLYLQRLFLLGIEFWSTCSFILALEISATSFWSLWFQMRNSLSLEWLFTCR